MKTNVMMLTHPSRWASSVSSLAFMPNCRLHAKKRECTDVRYTCCSASHSWGTQPHVLSRSSQPGQTTWKCLLCRALALQQYCSKELRGNNILWLKSWRIGVFPQKLIYLLIKIEIISTCCARDCEVPFYSTEGCFETITWCMSPSSDVDEIKPYFWCYLWLRLLLRLERKNLYSAITSVYGWLFFLFLFFWVVQWLYVSTYPLGISRKQDSTSSSAFPSCIVLQNLHILQQRENSCEVLPKKAACIHMGAHTGKCEHATPRQSCIIVCTWEDDFAAWQHNSF